MTPPHDLVPGTDFFGINVASTSPQMSALIARTDWSQTALGPGERWPPALWTILEVMLANRFPMVLWWGPDLVQLYNDPYIPMLGSKHPASLGQAVDVCWREIWDVIGPQITSVYNGGASTWNEDLHLEMNRHGFVEETYFTFSYSPVPDPLAPSGIGGVLGTVQETSEKVIGERRITLLRDLATRGTEAQSVEEECRLAAATLGRYSKSVPFSLLYLLDERRESAHLAASSGIEMGTYGSPATVDLTGSTPSPWPLDVALRTEDVVVVEALDPRFDRLAPGPWPEPPRSAVVVPIPSNIPHAIAGFLVGGVSRRSRFEDRYRSFFRLVAAQIASAIASARAYEEERKRAEALAEIDRAKTAFFSNISHEFRTPLTLMIGPLAELMRTADAEKAPLLEAAHRNSLRLLKLVNTLLEFSRLEAGRDDAAFAETDLATLTEDLCATFRSAIEAGGLGLVVDVDLAERVYVDRSMWEKIVLNLLSNALKFTFEGEIRVALRAVDDAAELRVSDTGTGIAPADLPHLFERFRRIRGAKSRSHEGSGIGLALVRELVELHGGTIDASSDVGRGTRFTVRLPLGRAHLDESKIVLDDQASQGASVVEQYLADVDATITRAGGGLSAISAALPSAKGGRVLFADDNGDLRAYVSRLLAPRYDVVTVRNGAEGLRIASEQRFDLIISDAMMPEMDGFEFLRAVRADEALKGIPFIMLSARAGEEAAIEGLQGGADDYVTKPFSSEELLARVYAQLSAAALRDQTVGVLRSSEERFRALVASMPDIVIESDSEGNVTFLSEAFTTFTGLPREAEYGTGWAAVMHPDDLPGALEKWRSAMASGAPFSNEFRLRGADGAYRWHVARALPQRDADGNVLRWSGTMTDFHDVRRAAKERELFAEAGRILSESLDTQTTLRSLADLTIPQFADWCRIDLGGGDGSVETAVIAHRDALKNARAQQFVGGVRRETDAAGCIPAVLRTGRSRRIDELPADAGPTGEEDADEAVFRELGFRSAACIPLAAHGKTLGVLTVVYSESLRRYGDDDLPVLEELGRRAGLALQKANAFERERRVAASFQEASLPPALPEMYGITFDAVYVPGGDEAQIGGDWYDAVRLFDGRVVVSIGDVAGHGLRAAVTMGNMRQIIRGIAQVHADPALMLDAADRALRLEHPDEFVTAFVGVLDPIVGTFAFASAGHPPPMLRNPSGDVELLSDGGLPLGLRQSDDGGRGKTIFIPNGSYLVFYTDGLTELGRNPCEGEERLRRLLGEGSVFSEEHPAWSLKEAFFDGNAAAADDDVAILVMSISGDARSDAARGSEIQRWSFDSADARSAQTARRAFADGLRILAATPDRIHAAEVVFGELVGNAARHAPGPVEVTVDWTGSSPVLHVLDEGPGFQHIPALPKDVYSESGRGLFLISLLTEDFHVSKRPTGGSHARAVLPLNRRL